MAELVVFGEDLFIMMVGTLQICKVREPFVFQGIYFHIKDIL